MSERDQANFVPAVPVTPTENNHEGHGNTTKEWTGFAHANNQKDHCSHSEQRSNNDTPALDAGPRNYRQPVHRVVLRVNCMSGRAAGSPINLYLEIITCYQS